MFIALITVDVYCAYKSYLGIYLYNTTTQKTGGKEKEGRKKNGMKEDSNPAPSARRDYTSPLYRIRNTPQRLVP